MIAISHRAEGPACRRGVPGRAARRPIDDVVAAAEQAAADGSPAEDARPLLGPGDATAFGCDGAGLGGPPGTIRSPGRRSGCSAPSPRSRRRRSPRRRRRAGSCSASPSTTLTTHVPGHVDGAAAAPRPADGQGRPERQVGRPDPLHLGRAAAPGTSPTWTSPPWTPAWRQRLDWAEPQDRAARRAVRDAAATGRRGRPDGLPVLVGGGRGRPGRAHRVQQAGRRHPGRRAAGRAAASTLRSDPALPGLGCAPFVVAHASGRRRPRCSTTGCRWRRTAWIPDGELAALIQTRHTAELSGLPVTPAIDNLVLDGPPGSRRIAGRHGGRHAAAACCSPACGTSARSTRRRCCSPG